MIAPSSDLKIYVATRPVDFRRGLDGLAAAAQEVLGLDPYSGAAIVFRAKRCQRRSKNRPLWRSKSRPLMLRQVQSKGPRSGPFAFGRFDGSVFVDGGLVLLRPAGSGATATG